MSHSEHASIEELLHLAADGLLTPAEQERLDAHLRRHPESSSVLEDVEALRDLLSDLPAQAAPEGFARRVMETHTTGGSLSVVGGGRRLLWFGSLAMAAAAVLLMVSWEPASPDQSTGSPASSVVAESAETESAAGRGRRFGGLAAETRRSSGSTEQGDLVAPEAMERLGEIDRGALGEEAEAPNDRWSSTDSKELGTLELSLEDLGSAVEARGRMLRADGPGEAGAADEVRSATAMARDAMEGKVLDRDKDVALVERAKASGDLALQKALGAEPRAGASTEAASPSVSRGRRTASGPGNPGAAPGPPAPTTGAGPASPGPLAQRLVGGEASYAEGDDAGRVRSDPELALGRSRPGSPEVQIGARGGAGGGGESPSGNRPSVEEADIGGLVPRAARLLEDKLGEGPAATSAWFMRLADDEAEGLEGGLSFERAVLFALSDDAIEQEIPARDAGVRFEGPGEEDHEKARLNPGFLQARRALIEALEQGLAEPEGVLGQSAVSGEQTSARGGRPDRSGGGFGPTPEPGEVVAYYEVVRLAPAEPGLSADLGVKAPPAGPARAPARKRNAKDGAPQGVVSKDGGETLAPETTREDLLRRGGQESAGESAAPREIVLELPVDVVDRFRARLTALGFGLQPRPRPPGSGPAPESEIQPGSQQPPTATGQTVREASRPGLATRARKAIPVQRIRIVIPVLAPERAPRGRSEEGKAPQEDSSEGERP